MELKQLEVFTKLYELKSFSKVAKELNISQPTVTMQLKQLEEELNTVLFARTTREIKETPDAVRLYSMAVEMLNYRDHLLSQFNDNGVREFSIGASLLPAHFILPEIMDDLKHKHSPLMIKAVEGVTSEIVSKVADKELDIGIIGTQLENDKCHYEKLTVNEFIFVAPANSYYKKLKEQNPNLETLIKEPLILLETSGILDTITSILRAGGIDPDTIKPVAVMNGIFATKQLVIKGIGCTFISKLAVQDEIDSGEMVAIPIPENLQVNHIYLIWNKDNSHNENVRKVSSEIINVFENKYGQSN